MKIKLNHIKNGIIYVTPNFSEGETVRYKIKVSSLLLYGLLYSFLIIMATIVILTFTPLKRMIYHYEVKELKEQAAKTVELEKKIIFLTKELESISSTNKKLEYAFILATSDSIDSTSNIYDSLRYEKHKNLPYGGNLLYIFNEFWNKFFQNDNQLVAFFIKPSKGLIINEFNPDEGHFGVDFAVSTGTSVFASQGGLILFADFTIDDGYKIIIQHDNEYITVYKHCSSILKKERDTVFQGDLIALSGNSGSNTTGPHLHFEIWKNGKPINPREIFIK